jgi:peptidoglycan/xylan/chitin deacetylase (PgdA/CDA1 family)
VWDTEGSGIISDMQLFPSKCKEGMLKILAFVLFHVRALRLINFFVNRFQPKKSAADKLVFPFVQKRASRNVQILAYHRINEGYDPFFPTIPIAVFARQMDYLSSNFDVLPLEEAIARIIKKDIPDNVLVLTFDDGYKDNYLNAFPILRKFSIPATIFLSTDPIDSERVLWHDLIFSAFRETCKSCLIWPDNKFDKYPLRTLEERLIAQNKVLKFLRSLDRSDRLLWIDRLRESLGVENMKGPRNLMLTWNDIKKMSRNGISFGSHTVNHPILSRISPDEVRKEIYESKRVIEEHLGVPVRTFAYPNGKREDFTEATKSILREAGYICGLTTIFGANEPDQDLFELRRGGPWEHSIPEFATKLQWYKFYSPT